MAAKAAGVLRGSAKRSASTLSRVPGGAGRCRAQMRATSGVAARHSGEIPVVGAGAASGRLRPAHYTREEKPPNPYRLRRKNNLLRDSEGVFVRHLGIPSGFRTVAGARRAAPDPAPRHPVQFEPERVADTLPSLPSCAAAASRQFHARARIRAPQSPQRLVQREEMLPKRGGGGSAAGEATALPSLHDLALCGLAI